MLRTPTLLFAPCFALLVACGPSINQAYKVNIDQRVAALRPGTTSYPAIDANGPMPLAVGQWLQMKLVDEKQQPSFMTYKIVGQQGDAFWIETSSETYTTKSETRMLVNLGDRTNLDAVEVKAFKMRTDGELQEYPDNLLGLMKAVWKPFVRALVVDWTDMTREDTAVPAGSFAGCYRHRATITFGPYQQTSDSWQHPAVPINGMVRSTGVDKPTSVQLVAFGTQGAKSTF